MHYRVKIATRRKSKILSHAAQSFGFDRSQPRSVDRSGRALPSSVELVPGVGLEPTRVFTQRILSPLRLPVSSPRLGPTEFIICSGNEVLKRGEDSSRPSSSASRSSHSLTVRAILLPRAEVCEHISRRQSRHHGARGLEEDAEVPLHKQLQ